MKSYTKDLTGMKFHKWEVLEFLGYEHHRAYWICKCERCGIKKSILADRLNAGTNPRCETCTGEFGNPMQMYHRNAKQQGMEFTLETDEFQKLAQGGCHYCGIEPVQEFKKRGQIFFYNDIDCIERDKGYVSGNCVSCCETCKRMRGTMKYEEFLNHILRITKNRI